jgi:two-component system response regulator
MENDVEILLVENSPDDVELTLRALRSGNFGSHVHVVNDGEQALDFLFCRGAYAGRDNQSQPRLVFLDLKLPKIDGLAVLRELKLCTLTRSIPIVILTSSREEQDIIRGYQLGVNSYIQKPVDFGKFRETVCQLGWYWLLLNQPHMITNSMNSGLRN